MVRALKYALTTVIVIGLIVAFLMFVLEIPLPWKAAAAGEPGTPPPPRATTEPVELFKGIPHTVQVPVSVRESLGIRKGSKDNLVMAKAPTQARPLVMPGSTALDPARIIRIRARFAPAEVVKIGETRDFLAPSTQFRELRPGDKVKVGDELGVFYSVDVGNKKNDLFEAIVQYRLDKIVLDKAELAAGALPDVFLWNARRNVQTDRSGIIRAKNMLKVWNIAEDDIQEVIKEANSYDLAQRLREAAKEADWGEQQEKWARVVLKAPCSGVIVERNIAPGEIVVDNTLALFTLAQVDRLAVLVNIPEDELPTLQELPFGQRKWTIQTVGANSVKGLAGTIDEIGYLIDPNMHTAIIKGYIDNPKNERAEHLLRAGQFVSATVSLLPPKDVVELPGHAIVEDGRQSAVFVVTDAASGRYTLRRVVVTQRGENTVLVRSTPIPEAEQLTPQEKEEGLLPRQPLQVGEMLLGSGVLELKAALEDIEAKRSSDDK